MHCDNLRNIEKAAIIRLNIVGGLEIIWISTREDSPSAMFSLLTRNWAGGKRQLQLLMVDKDWNFPPQDLYFSFLSTEPLNLFSKYSF